MNPVSPENRLSRWAKKISLALGFFLLLWSQNACRNQDDLGQPSATTTNLRSGARTTSDDDPITSETATLLGVHLPNPYTLPTMQQAYFNVTGNNSPVSATHLYVRFKPSSLDQLSVLEDDLDLDLSDEPLDYEVLQEGDYYQDPSIPDDQITWLYAVVDPNFSFPSGIQYEILATIHIPNDLLVEAEAERLAGLNADGDGLASCNNCRTAGGGVQPNVVQCSEGYHWDPAERDCVPDNCGPGAHWDANEKKCVPDGTPPTPTIPAGQIRVQDTQFGIEGVRKVRVVAKRWFKIERMYTDNFGYFTSTKNFRKKVKVLVKFKNEDATVKGIKGIRIWQARFPVKYKVGTYSGVNLNTITPDPLTRNASTDSKGQRNWVAATVHNAVQQYRNLAASQGTGLPPSGIKILISNLGSGDASTPMLSKIAVSTPYDYFGFVVGYNSIINGVAQVILGSVDLLFSYNFQNGGGSAQSDRIYETTFHELSHAAHFSKAGSITYNLFVTSVINEVISNIGNGFAPYGNGSNSYSAIIALGEGWAFHYGHFLADLRYGSQASCQSEQIGGSTWCSSRPHLDVLENYDPNLPSDRFRWIPKGLMLDLIDTNNETRPPQFVNDNVSGYTNQQIFNALESDVRSIPAFKDRLLQQNGNNQQNGVNILVQEYGY